MADSRVQLRKRYSGQAGLCLLQCSTQWLSACRKAVVTATLHFWDGCFFCKQPLCGSTASTANWPEGQLVTAVQQLPVISSRQVAAAGVAIACLAADCCHRDAACFGTSSQPTSINELCLCASTCMRTQLPAIVGHPVIQAWSAARITLLAWAAQPPSGGLKV